MFLRSTEEEEEEEGVLDSKTIFLSLFIEQG